MVAAWTSSRSRRRTARRGSTSTARASRPGRWWSATAPAVESTPSTSSPPPRRGRGAGFTVALVEQPYRVAGRRSPAPAKQLDAAWEAVIAELRERELITAPLVAGGRSLGARVACRTAEPVGAAAVLCLAFPVHPPGKADDPSKSRQGELDGVELPTLVVQGESDPFGMPTAGANRRVVKVTGNHGLKADPDAIGAAVGDWLGGLAA